MTETVVYGASDDLIEVEGEVREEFTALSDDTGLLGFSDGTVLRIIYSDSGVWRICPAAIGRAFVEIVQAPEDDDTNYSDRATLREGVQWVVYGASWAVAKNAKIASATA